MSRNYTVEILCDAELADTPKAILYQIDCEEVWIPKSLIEDSYESDDGRIYIHIPEWFAEKEGLEW